jgi:hypothetical protein
MVLGVGGAVAAAEVAPVERGTVGAVEAGLVELE